MISARPGSILVVHPDRKTQRMLHRVLGATLRPLDVVDNLAQAVKLLDQRTPDLVVLDARTFVQQQGRLTWPEATACLVLYSEEAQLPELLGVDCLTNLLVHRTPFLAEDLTVTALKLLRRDIFGLEKYLTLGVEVVAVEPDDAQARIEIADELSHRVRELGFAPRIASLASLVADELLSNALYNGPYEDGRRYRVEDQRAAPRSLVGRERVSLRYACDARYLAIEVSDRFGSLDRVSVLRHLARCAAAGEKVTFDRAGAGVGLGLVYQACTSLIFNLAKGVRSEVIGLIDLRFQPAELGRHVSSFNVFVQEDGR
jgi:hypothetical protein